MEGQYPHRVVGSIADGILNGVKGLGQSATGAMQEAGKTLMRGLDGPFASITGIEGPHRAIDRLADGAKNTTDEFFGQGVVGSVETAGEGLMKALDHPLDQLKGGHFGIPKMFKR